MSKMATMTNDELSELVRLHVLWLQKAPTGRRLELHGAKVAGAALKGVRLNRAKFVEVDFSGADLQGTSFHQSEFENVHFDGAGLQETDFSECDARRCRFDGARLDGGSLAGSKISECSFRHARLERNNLAKSTVFRTSFAGAVLAECHFSRCEMKNCDVQGCDLQGANLQWATLADTDLRGANLTDARLYGTLLVRDKVAGTHGTPFLAEHFGEGLDFSPDGDGSQVGTLERLRMQLGGGPGPGSGRYGLGATPTLYRAYEVTDNREPYFAISRLADDRDFFRIRKVEVDDVCLVLEYEEVGPSFENWLAGDLIFDVFLRDFLKDVHRGKVFGVDFRNLTTGSSHISDYGVHQPPAKPRRVPT